MSSTTIVSVVTFFGKYLRSDFRMNIGKRKKTREKILEIINNSRRGAQLSEIAKQVNISSTTLYQYIYKDSELKKNYKKNIVAQ